MIVASLDSMALRIVLTWLYASSTLRALKKLLHLFMVDKASQNAAGSEDCKMGSLAQGLTRRSDAGRRLPFKTALL
jgi:hypothetical protein